MATTTTQDNVSRPITIRRAEGVDDYRACQDAQRRAWGLHDEGYVVPVATMVAAQLHGGLVLGAFLPDGTAAGLSFAFLGRVEGRIGLYSQLTGVVPGFQAQGIGRRLKAAQREFALAEGLSCIAWAFDPLQAGNARFNLNTLGATAVRFVENMYGPRNDALNRNTPTDRLIAVWETVPNPASTHSIEGEPARHPLIETTPGPDGPSTPRFHRPATEAPRLLLAIPKDINRMRAETPSLAEPWSAAVREAFLWAFDHGYRAVGFRTDEPSGNGGAYLLERPDAPNGSATQSA